MIAPANRPKAVRTQAYAPPSSGIAAPSSALASADGTKKHSTRTTSHVNASAPPIAIAPIVSTTTIALIRKKTVSSRRSSRRSLERSACPAGRTSTAVIAPGGVAIGSQPRYSGSPLSRRCQGGRWSSGSWVPSRRSPTATAVRCTGRPLRLLALLLVHRGRGVPADVAIEALWGDALPDHPGTPCRPSSRAFAGRSARTRCSSRADGYRLADGELDAQRFGRLARAGHDALARGEPAARRRAAGRGTRALARPGARGRPLRAVRRRRSPSGSRRCGSRPSARGSTPARPRPPPRAGPGAARARGGAPAARVAARPADARALPLRAPVRRARRLQRASRRRSATQLGLDPSPELRALERSILRHEAGVPRTAAGAARRRLRQRSTCARPARRAARPRAPARGDRALPHGGGGGRPAPRPTRRSSCAATGSPRSSAPRSRTRTTRSRQRTSRASCSMRSPVSPASWHRTTSISRPAPASRRDPR